MTSFNSEAFRDEELTAYLDGELSGQRTAELERAMTGDEELAARVAFFRAVSGALEMGLAAQDSEVVVSEGGDQFRSLWPAVLVLAAAAIVAIIGFWPDASKSDANRAGQEDERVAQPETNEFLSVRAVPLRGGSWPVWSEVAIEMHWQALGDGDVHLIGDDKMLADLPESAVPVLIDAVITKPDGDVVRAKWRSPYKAKVGKEPVRRELPVWQLKFAEESISPLVAAAPDGESWKEDFRWGFGAVGGPSFGTRGFVPQEFGEYTVRVSIRSPEPPEGQTWRTFEEPLVVETAFRVTGFATEWSEPTDGLSARLVASSNRLEGKGSMAIGLQLRNDSTRPRTYNVTGVTRAEIPQPFHLSLIVDGKPWKQRDDLAVITMAGTLFLPQPVGSVRSVVVMPSYWRLDGKGLHELLGKHQVQLQFDFKPSLWNGANQEIWMGKVDTPPLEIAVVPVRR